jgi:hypothetical protein
MQLQAVQAVQLQADRCCLSSFTEVLQALLRYFGFLLHACEK